MKMDGPILEHDPDALRLGRGVPYRLVEAHQLLDANCRPRLEQDSSAERISRTDNPCGSVARQTALRMRTGFSRFFVGSGQARLPIRGQFVQIEQDFLALVFL